MTKENIEKANALFIKIETIFRYVKSQLFYFYSYREPKVEIEPVNLPDGINAYFQIKKKWIPEIQICNNIKISFRPMESNTADYEIPAQEVIIKLNDEKIFYAKKYQGESSIEEDTIIMHSCPRITQAYEFVLAQ